MLPGVYERWFQELCGQPSPEEKRAHCDDCNMLPGSPELPPEGPFNPEVRCCTYHPQLPPHVVGALLLQRNKMIEERVDARLGVTPHGLGPSPEYAAVWKRVGQTADAFGHKKAILCPFHEDTRCTIWSQRGVACAAFHCQFDRGPLGHGVWNLIVVAFHAVDHALLKRLVQEAGLDGAVCDALLHGDRSKEAQAWGRWYGRERDYFLEAARLAEEADVASFPELARLGDSLRGVLARLNARPERVRKNDEVLYQLGRVRHPSVPFDALTLAEGVAEKLEASRLDFDEATLRQLLDWQVLVPA